MKIRLLNCVFCLILLLVVNSFSQNLVELQISSWDLVYQIKLQNQRTPQFVDVIRKKNVYVKPIAKTELSETDIQAATSENKQIACETFAIRARLIVENVDKNAGKDFFNNWFKAFGENFNDYQMSDEKLVKNVVRLTKN